MSRVLFVNLTKRCNVDCPRCYILERHRKGRDAFGLSHLRRALESDFFQDAAARPTLIFQGGEPQLVGAREFNRICETVREIHPDIRMTCVSNLLAAPDWYIDLVRTHFEGRAETTWAAGRKMTLGGDEGAFQDAFARSLARMLDAGLSCPVNVETNAETVSAGPGAILDLHRRTGAIQFEFDISVAFDRFLSAPEFGAGNLPVLPPTVPYAAVARFLLDLRRAIRDAGLSDRFRTQVLDPPERRGGDHAFNVGRELDFVTMNPDGSVTTNPLFSDIPETYLGSLAEAGLDKILDHPNRRRRSIMEARRTIDCTTCPHFEGCRGGSSHIPLLDASGECAGLKRLLDELAVPDTRKA